MNNNESLFAIIFKKISSGFLLGLGFTIAMILVGYIASKLFNDYEVEKTYVAEESSTSYDYKQFDENAGLEIVKYQDQSTPDQIIVIGSLINESEHPWDNITIEVELFLNNEFVTECSGYINGKVKHNEIENFKVSCGGCNNYTLPDYDKLTVRIKSAH